MNRTRFSGIPWALSSLGLGVVAWSRGEVLKQSIELSLVYQRMKTFYPL